MSEFQEKVAAIKEKIQEAGFSPPTEDIPEDSPLSDNTETDLESEQKQEFSSPPKKNKHQTLKKRIDQLTYENKLKDSQTQALLNRVQEQEYLLSEREEQLKQKELHTNAYYENNLQNRKLALKDAIKAAKEEGDINREVELTQESEQIAAELAAHSLYKHQILPKELEQNYNRQQIVQQQTQYEDPRYNPNYIEPQTEHNEELDYWLERNPWADPYSQEFDQELRSEVNEIALELDKRLKFNGNANLIGTPEYFTSLDNIMRDRWGHQTQPQNEPPQYSNTPYQSPVAPVTRNGSSMSEQYVAQKSLTHRHPGVALNPQELAIARNLQIKTTNGFAPQNKALESYEKKKKKYEKDPSNKITID
mgnify:FL=1